MFCLLHISWKIKIKKKNIQNYCPCNSSVAHETVKIDNYLYWRLGNNFDNIKTGMKYLYNTCTCITRWYGQKVPVFSIAIAAGDTI